jgi:hypothetical protein
MTGEGITPAMESALIGSSVLIDSLEQGRFDSAFLSLYNRRFHQYFDPGWIYVDLCAALMRNRCFRDSWLKMLARGCRLAQKDADFARVVGATFGGLKIEPFEIISRIWMKTLGELNPWLGLIAGDGSSLSMAFGDLLGWQVSFWQSLVENPVWHLEWTSDIVEKWGRFISIFSVRAQDPRAEGLL